MDANIKDGNPPGRYIRFVDEFMTRFCPTCIAIESFSGKPYKGFYDGFWEHFDDFMASSADFRADEALATVKADFDVLVPGQEEDPISRLKSFRSSEEKGN